MDAIKSLKSYWLQRSYQKLEDIKPTKKILVVKLAGGGKTRRRSKKTVVVRSVLRLKKKSVPKTQGKVMSKLREAYLNAMLMLAGGSGGAAVWDRRIPTARKANSKVGDFERSFMVHLHNSVIATR